MNLLGLVQRHYPKGRFSERARKAMEISDYLPACRLFLPAPEKTIAGIDEWFQPRLVAASKPWFPDALREMDAAGNGERREKVAGRNLILQIMLSSLYHTYKFGLTTEAERRGTLRALSMQRHRDRYGRWPRSLDDCPWPDLGHVRLDPVSGREFVYQVRDGRPWLYSVGFDREDDGGKHDPRWGLDRTGHDYVLFPPP